MGNHRGAAAGIVCAGIAIALSAALAGCGGRHEDPYAGMTAEERLAAMAAEDERLSYDEGKDYAYRNSELVVYAIDGADPIEVASVLSAYGRPEADDTLSQGDMYILKLDAPMDEAGLTELAGRVSQEPLVDRAELSTFGVVRSEAEPSGASYDDGDEVRGRSLAEVEAQAEQERQQAEQEAQRQAEQERQAAEQQAQQEAQQQAGQDGQQAEQQGDGQGE